MRTSPAAGGSGISPTTRTSRAGPCFSYQAAFIWKAMEHLRPNAIDHSEGYLGSVLGRVDVHAKCNHASGL
jgi:hypothetical protein